MDATICTSDVSVPLEIFRNDTSPAVMLTVMAPEVTLPADAGITRVCTMDPLLSTSSEVADASVLAISINLSVPAGTG